MPPCPDGTVSSHLYNGLIRGPCARSETPLAARRAIADEIRTPLGGLSEEDRRFVDALVARTLSRPEVMAAVRERFPQGRKGGVGAC